MSKEVNADLKQQYFNDYATWKLDQIAKNPKMAITDFPTFERYLEFKGISLTDTPKLKKRRSTVILSDASVYLMGGK